MKSQSMRNGHVKFLLVLALAICSNELLFAPASIGATKSCWSILQGGINYCQGKVSFDGGGQFAGATNERRFRTWAATGKPATLELNSVSTGLLRWKGKGDCLYTHGAGGNWLVWCGTRAAIRKLVDDTDGEWDGESYELFCTVKRRVEVMDVTPRGMAYPEETCDLIGGKPQ
jgi:hypothetical protein